MKTNDDVIVIAVGLYRAPLAELTQIATSDDLVFYTKDFHRIWNFFTQLTKKMCSLHPKGNDFQPHYLTFRQLPVNFRCIVENRQLESTVLDATEEPQTTIPELTTKLTTSLSTAGITTTKQAVETTMATSVAETTTVPIEEEPKPVLFILPSDVKPEEVQDLLSNVGDENNVTVIVGSTVVLENKPKEDIQPEDISEDVLSKEMGKSTQRK